jgi:hypothetical protein
MLHKHMGASLVTTVVQAAKKALFPDGWPGPPPLDPSLEEQVAIREELVHRLVECVPGLFVSFLFSEFSVMSLQQRQAKSYWDQM